jgi:NADH:ubiquinone oxidoreductase subunit F (NADH-binding)
MPALTLDPPLAAPLVGVGRLLPAAAMGGGCRTLAGHLGAFGPLPSGLEPGAIVSVVERAGLRGRGGAGFPMARKMLAVAGARGTAVVVANAAEGEPASSKDSTLLRAVPHLVLDGLQIAARAVRADRACLYLHPKASVRDAEALLADRRARGIDAVPVQVVRAPDRFLSGEESAVVRRLSGGPALPASKLTPVWQKGVDGRPTMVSNAETLAHLALLIRRGDSWFREVGTPMQPGSMLTTISGAVASPGVLEVAHGATIGEVLTAAGLRTVPAAVLLGGYHGTWLPGREALDLPLREESLQPWGATVGAGVLMVLPSGVCGLAETARMLGYLAGESAGQCGPCLNGLPALAQAMSDISGARQGGAADADRVEQLAGLVERRGACHHPDGTVRLARSALRVFADDLASHARGSCNQGARHA